MKTTALPWLGLLQVLLSTVLLGTSSTAQTACYNFGSTPVAAMWEASAIALGCPRAPLWPQWHLFTPPHRAPRPHVGYNPGNAHLRPRVIVIYRCTGLLFVPVIIDRIRIMGYVTDQPEIECAIDR